MNPLGHKVRIGRRGRNRSETGASLLEILIVVVILLVMAAIAIPQFQKAARSYRLHSAVTDTSGVIQQLRIRSIADSRFYSVYVLPETGNTVKQVFGDIFPQAINGASGTGGAAVNAGDPVATLPPEIVVQPVAAAPSTAALTGLFLPLNSPIAPLDGSAAASPVTFGPDGLPCTPTAVVGGTLCNSRGTATAYWLFFENSRDTTWGALTITPAGHIQRWVYVTTWAKY